ncbi:hypothetical protein E6W36_08680 [Hankyongella ginsenosidimutans]|uniref:Uncharacterized protein n=1 Tax=Hankyongella ginsenosidimutans TaxID=1763828 RepID=A0A4D7C854_9SPHN|nr:hypothetical protein E6W36_08680 [Hankyongella ginsenosidimutans]
MGLGVMATVLHHGDDSAGSVLVLAMDSGRRAKYFRPRRCPTARAPGWRFREKTWCLRRMP